MRILILNQAFHPDVVATAQHATDLALGLANAGHNVTVVCSSRGYDDPSKRFPTNEEWNGIRIHRIPTLGLGKAAKWRRAADFAWFLAACSLRTVTLGKFDVVVALTSPPLISFLAAVLSPLNRAKLVYWTMDLNPDEAIAAGWLRADSLAGRLLSAFQTYSLRKASRIVSLDRFMRDRIVAKGVAADKIVIIEPWSHDEDVRFDKSGRDAFRAEHRLSDKLVVMYSGNHSPCHPLDTLLGAASQLRDRNDIVLLFVGGGSEMKKVQALKASEGLNNVVCLPYQPREKLAASLSAADLHVVVMGEPFVGIVHPCKIYNILTVGAPFLYVGPQESHVTELPAQARDFDTNLFVSHGQSDAIANFLVKIAERPIRPRHSVDCSQFSKAALLPRMIAAVESAAETPVPKLAKRASAGEAAD